MNTKNILASSVLALAAFSGSAFAAGFVPASGAYPLFQNEPTAQSTLTRADVERQAAAMPPESGNVVAQAPVMQSTLTRAEVHAQAIATPPASGAMSVIAQSSKPSNLSRAEVRAQLLNAQTGLGE